MKNNIYLFHKIIEKNNNNYIYLFHNIIKKEL